MSGFFTQVISWRALVAAVVVFGFAPGAVLRLIVLVFGRSDPRRRELLAELHAVPRWERPVWVAEQLEVALAEGIGGRLARAWRRLAPGRRTAEWWRRENEEARSTRYTIGHNFASVSGLGIGIYLLVLVPGAGRWISYAAWSAVSLTMAWCHQRNRRRLQPGQPVPATRFHAVVLIPAGLAAYAFTAYLFIADVAALASGSMSAGRWAGAFLCPLVLWYPWEVIRSGRWAARAGEGQRPQEG